MKADPDRSTIVIVGSWNQAIFTEAWVQQNVLRGPDAVRQEVALTAQGTLLRFTGNLARLVVRADRVIWAPLRFDNEALGKMESAASQLLGLLSVTPITGLGVNYGFNVSEPIGLLKQSLDPADSQKMLGLGAEIRGVLIKRTVRWQDRTVNLGLERDLGPAARIDINFHSDVSGALDARAKIAGAVVPLKQVALDLISGLYELHLEGG